MNISQDKHINIAAHLAAAILFFLGIAAVFIPEVRLALKYPISFLSLSRSDTKVYIFLFVPAVLLILPPSLRIPARQFWYVVALAMALYILGLSQFLYTVQITGSELHNSILLFSPSGITSTQLIHIHDAKAALSQLMHDIGFTSPLPGYDTGLGVLSMHPIWMLRLQYGAILVLGLSLLHLLRRAREEAFWRNLLWIISGISLWKGVIDGGIFWTENVLALLIFTVVGSARCYQWNNRRLIVALGAAVSLYILGFTFLSQFSLYWWVLSAASEPLYAYLCVTIIGLLWERHSLTRILCGAALVLLPQLYYLNQKQWVYDLKLPFQMLEAGSRLRAHYPSSELQFRPGLGVIQESSVISGAVTRTDFRVSRPMPVYQLHEVGIPISARFFSIVDKECDLNVEAVKYYRIFPLTSQMQDWQQSFLAAQSAFVQEIRSLGSNAWNYEVVFEGCIGDPLAVLGDLFHQVGDVTVAVSELRLESIKRE